MLRCCKIANNLELLHVIAADLIHHLKCSVPFPQGRQERCSGGPRRGFCLPSPPALGAGALQSHRRSWLHPEGRRGVQRPRCWGDLGWLVALVASWWQLQGRWLHGERKDTWRSSALIAQMEKERGSREREEDAPDTSYSIN